MKIALCGPVSLHLIRDLVDESDCELHPGHQYPLAAYLAREFHKLGHTVSLISHVYGVNKLQRWSGPRFNVFLNPRRRMKQFLFDCYYEERKATIESLKLANPDIVHAQWVYDYAHAAALSAYPHLVIIRDYPWAIARLTKSPYRVFRALYAHHVVPKIENLSAISDYVAKPFKKIYEYRKAIRVIPNGLAPSLFFDEWES